MTFEWWTIPVIILIILAIILVIYMIIAFRRMSISVKKIDYLIEDLSYKSEKISPSLDSLIKLLNYIELLDNLIKEDGIKLINNLIEDKKNLNLILIQLRDFISKHQKDLKNYEENSASTKNAQKLKDK
ncbi:hypothetical protein [Mycoplasmoides alvi]|uniref:hypothetical protein n=1 Tax=Mycoplasmoides alvi TaxID=78580 RepID=UPI00051C1FF4|nr:hypothetical protein [Mycoplasmoides alvi]